MGAIKVKDVVGVLKTIIDRNGPTYLNDEPYQVYKEVLASGMADGKTAAAILHVLVTPEIMDNMDYFCEAELVSELIRRECNLNKRMADRMALILASLYSSNHRKEWKAKEREGMNSFLKEEFICSWNGFAVWDAGNGTVDCHYEAQIKLKPTEKISKDEELAGEIKKNPFITKETIHNLFSKRLHKYLNSEFEDYCTCDDYYQPVVEDFGFNMIYNLQRWCEENGFEYVSFEGDGDDSGYEPKCHRGWK